MYKLCALCLVVVLLAPAASFAAPEFTLKFGHLANEENSWHKAALKFADIVKERSNGRVEVKVYPNEQLGKELDTVTSIQMGTADMVISGGSLMNWAPRYRRNGMSNRHPRF
jgi:TRAP-type C4-dicarboxylate transport system substrate-binding protein